MTEYFWRLPVEGDVGVRNLGLWNQNTLGQQTGYFREAANQGHHFARRDTFTYDDHLARVAQAAEATGFDGVLLPTSRSAEEAWLVAASLIRETRHLRFLPSFHTANFKPVHAARMAATSQRNSRHRFDWNIIAGDSDAVQRREGDFTSIEERLQRNGEFIEIARGVLTEKSFSYEGGIYQVDKGGLQPPMSNIRVPSIYLSGDTEAAREIAARYADTYLTWAEPLDRLVPKLDDLRARAAKHGRTLKFGLRVDLIARDDDATAWAEARRLWETADRQALRAKQTLTGDDIDGLEGERDYLRRFAEARRFEDTVIAQDLWAAEGPVRPGAAVTIVGSFATIAARIATYRAAGIDSFQFAAWPSLEEAYRVGEDLLPLLRGEIAARAAE